MLLKKHKKIKKYLKKFSNRGAVKMSNFGSIIMITFLVSAFSYFLVGGSIFTIEEPPAGSTVVIPQLPKTGQSTNSLQLTTFGGASVAPAPINKVALPTASPIPTQPTATSGGPSSITVTIGCTEKGTVQFAFSLTVSSPANIGVTFPVNENIPNANIALTPGETKTVDTGKAAMAGGAITIKGAPGGEGSKNFPARLCAIPTPTPVQ